MHQLYEVHPAIRMNYDEARKEAFDPRPSAHQNGIGGPSARLRIVASPGGAAFVEYKPAAERI